MNSDLLALALMSDPNFTLQEVLNDEVNTGFVDETRASFEMVSEGGEIVGYIKTWHDDDDYAGFVHFDADGNVVDWKVFSRMHPQPLAAEIGA